MSRVHVPSTILITGAQGFVGRHLCASLQGAGFFVVRAARRRTDLAGASDVCLSHESSRDEMRNALSGVDVVVHLAARVHQVDDAPHCESYNQINCSWSLRLAEESAKAGVKRFVFLSTIKVNGDHNINGRPFRSSDVPLPSDAYGKSKLKAEMGLLQLNRDGALEVVIIRPPLVYGPGVKANFRSLMRLVDTGLPLPLGGIKNKRSLISVHNLVDLIGLSVESAEAAGRVLLCSDGRDLSTPELVQLLAESMGRQATLFPLPSWFLIGLGTLLGKGPQIKRLCGSLQVDIDETRRVLNWNPPVSVEIAMKETCRAALGSTNLSN